MRYVAGKQQGGKKAADSYAIEEFSGQIAVQMADLSASLGLDDSQQATIEALASQTLGKEDFKVTFKESMKNPTTADLHLSVNPGTRVPSSIEYRLASSTI